MINFLSATFLGWPAVLVTIILALIGLLRQNYRLLVIAAFIAFPFSWALSGFPLIQSPVFMLPLLLFGSGYFIYRDNDMLAWLLFVPYVMSIWLLLNAVMAQ